MTQKKEVTWQLCCLLCLLEVYCQTFYKLLLKCFHLERKMQHWKTIISSAENTFKAPVWKGTKVLISLFRFFFLDTCRHKDTLLLHTSVATIHRELSFDLLVELFKGNTTYVCYHVLYTDMCAMIRRKVWVNSIHWTFCTDVGYHNLLHVDGRLSVRCMVHWVHIS